ncbi:MAG: sugar ABC transporter substrate-binding protein [Planctomycetes bacterium]|nr:sugar ABC transporter substrate-binding protein [Planctomycetota bacterium]
MTATESHGITRKAWGLGVLCASVCFCGLLAVGCSSRRAGAAKTILKFSIWGTPSQVQVEQLVVDAFEALHPDVKVDIIHIPSRYPDKVMTMAVGGTAPDVMMMEITSYPAFAQKGALLNLEPFIQRDNLDFADVYPLAVDAFRYRGQLYALPRDISGHAMFYNKSIFDKAGMAYPTDEWTWDDFREACRKLTMDSDGDGLVEQYGAVFGDFQTLMWAFGGDVLDNPHSPTRCVITEPRALAALEFGVGLFREKVVAPPEVTRDQGWFQMFETGRVGMFFSGRWMTPNFKLIKGFEWDVTSVPKGPVGRATRHGGTAYSVSSKTRHPEAAWEFVKFYSGPEGTRIALQGGRTTPIYKSIALAPEFLGQRPPENMMAFVKTMEFGRRECYVVENALIADILARRFELLTLGQTQPAHAARAIRKEVEALLASRDFR